VTTVAAPTEPPAPRPRPKRRGRYIVAVGGCVVAVVAIIVLAVVLSENVVYFRTVTEAVHNRDDEGTSRFRMAGGVVQHSIVETKQGVDFLVTDGKHTVAVHHDGDTPALFKNGAPVVVEGHWASKATNAPFDSDRILIKHGADYTPPKVDTKKAASSS
jgi:cytochrome c-type biogenesis protein CcmE